MNINSKSFKLKAGVLIIILIFLISTVIVMAGTQENPSIVNANSDSIYIADNYQSTILNEVTIGYYNPQSVDTDAIGLSGGTPPYTWETAIRFPKEDLAQYEGYYIKGANVYHHAMPPSGEDRNCVFKIYLGGTPTQPGINVVNQPFTMSSTGWQTVILDEFYPVNPNYHLWISIQWESFQNDYPASVDGGPAVDGLGDWIKLNGQWSEIQGSGYDNNWCLEGILYMEEPLEVDAGGPYEAVIGEAIQFDGTVNGGVPPYDYEWDFGTGDFAYEEDPIYSYDSLGEYTIFFNVTDSEENSASDSTTVSITESEPLQVDAGGPYEGQVDESIQFTGSATGGVPPYIWHWDFGDGNTSDEQNPTHTYTEIGEYIVNLTVTDGEEEVAYDETIATINDTHTILEITDIRGGFGTVSAIIANIGDNDADNIEWTILITGGILGLINSETTDSIATIQPESSQEITSEFIGLFHLGSIEIEITAEADTADTVEVNARGFVIGPIVIIID